MIDTEVASGFFVERKNMDNQKRKLLEELGVDYDVTLERFLDKETFYFKILGQFVDRTDVADIEELLVCEDYEEAFRISHMLKGGTANLGLTRLYDVIVLLTEELRYAPFEQEKLMELYQDVKREYQSTKNKLFLILDRNI